MHVSSLTVVVAAAAIHHNNNNNTRAHNNDNTHAHTHAHTHLHLAARDWSKLDPIIYTWPPVTGLNFDRIYTWPPETYYDDNNNSNAPRTHLPLL